MTVRKERSAESATPQAEAVKPAHQKQENTHEHEIWSACA
jgi:hypothetical protein